MMRVVIVWTNDPNYYTRQLLLIMTLNNNNVG